MSKLKLVYGRGQINHIRGLVVFSNIYQNPELLAKIESRE